MKRAVASAIAALFMLAAAQVAGAETYTWTGGGDNVSFTDMQNWGQAEGTAFDTTGSYTFGSAAPSTVNVDSAVTASGTITFASGCPQMTVTGKKISGVAKFVNSSSYAQTFNNEVSFSGAVSLSQTNPIWFIGGATGTMSASTFYGNFTITTSGNWTAGSAFTIKDGSTVTASSMTFYNHNGYLTIEKGGKFIVGGGKMDNTSEKQFTQTINGEFVIDGTFNKTKSGGTTYIEKSPGTGVFLIKGVTVASDGVLVAAYNESDSSFDAGGARMIIGPDGILRGAGYVRAGNAGTHTFGAYADWNMRYQDNSYNNDYKAIYKSGNSGMTTLKFHTTDYYDKTVGRTITSFAQIGGANETCANNLCVVVSGIGKFVFANTKTNPTDLFAGGLTVQDSATVEVKKNSCPGKGKVALKDKSTLELRSGASVAGALTLGGSRRVVLPEAGTATISGKASFWTDSAACFCISGTANAKLVFKTTPEFQKNITISLTEDSDPLAGRSYTLTQGAGLTALSTDTTSFKLADGVRGTLSVVDGELVYNAPKYFYIKIADGAAQDLEIPWQWIVDNNAASLADSDAEVAEALLANGANGLPVWQSYCLGLEPNEAESVVLCEAAANQPPAGKVGIAARNLNVPESLSGVTVTAYLDKSTDGIDWSPAVSSATVSSGSAVFEPEIGDGISFFE